MNAARPAPVVLPVLPGVSLSGRYVLGDPSGESKGDCLDAVPVPGGRLGMFVADVVGVDGPADLSAEHLRAILRERLGSGAGLAEVMATVDRYAATHPQLVASTTVVAILDPADGALEWASAGHPPPLRLGPGAKPDFLTAPQSRPLGTGGAFSVQEDTLADGELLVLYTDGLVMFEGHRLDEGCDRLGEVAVNALAVASGDIPAHIGDQVCDRILADVSSTQSLADDSALLVASRTMPPAPLALRLPTDPEELPRLRHRVNRWLDALGVSLVDHVSLGHAVIELAANSISHAYVDREDLTAQEQMILVDAHLSADGRACITVADRGRWRHQESTGRGLMMAAGLADRMHVERRPTGTRVHLEQRLGRPVATLHAAQDIEAGQVWEEPAELEVEARPGGLRACGAIDEVSVEVFHSALSRATCSGTRDAVVDLGGVSHLASPGVQALFEFVTRAQRAGSHLTFRAGAGTPAAQVLEAVGLRAEATGD